MGRMAVVYLHRSEGHHLPFALFVSYHDACDYRTAFKTGRPDLDFRVIFWVDPEDSVQIVLAKQFLGETA